MTDTFNLVTEPWIPSLEADGSTLLSLRDVFSSRVFSIDTGDHLERAAIHRLLLAITIASRDAGVSAEQWLDSHTGCFDILDSSHPFAQNSRLAEVPWEKRPGITDSLLDYSSGTGSTGLYTVLEKPTNQTLALDDAARLLLVRQMFSPGGLGARLGKYTGSSATSFKQSLHYNTPFVWVEMPTLSESLSVMADLLLSDDPPRGTFWFGLEAPMTPGMVIEEPGVLDMLTYPSRSLKLWRSSTTGAARSMAVYEGLRIPDVSSTPDRYAQVFRQTGWWSMKPTQPATPRGIRTADNVRPAWKHLFECYAMCHDSSIVSPRVSLPKCSQLTFTTLAGDKSRIDNTVHWRFPSPQATEETVGSIAYYLDRLQRSCYGMHQRFADYRDDTSRDGHNYSRNSFSSSFNHRLNEVIPLLLSNNAPDSLVRSSLERVYTDTNFSLSSLLTLNYPLGAARMALARSPEWAAETTMEVPNE